MLYEVPSAIPMWCYFWQCSWINQFLNHYQSHEIHNLMANSPLLEHGLDLWPTPNKWTAKEWCVTPEAYYLSSAGERLRSRGQKSCFLLRAVREKLFHASCLDAHGLLTIFWCSTLSVCILTQCFPLCISVLCPKSLFNKDTSHIGWKPSLMTSFECDHLDEDLLSN